MRDDEIHIRLRPGIHIPPIIALAIFMTIAGVIVAAFKFVSENAAPVFCLLVLPFITWKALGYRRLTSRFPLRSVALTVLASTLTFGAISAHDWLEARRAAAEYEARMADYRAREERERPIRHARFVQSCRDGMASFQAGMRFDDYILNNCDRILTREQLVEVCRPLIARRAVPSWGWEACVSLRDEAVKQQAPRSKTM